MKKLENFFQKNLEDAALTAAKAIQSGLHGWEISAHTLDGLAELNKRAQNI